MPSYPAIFVASATSDDTALWVLNIELPSGFPPAGSTNVAGTPSRIADRFTAHIIRRISHLDPIRGGWHAHCIAKATMQKHRANHIVIADDEDSMLCVLSLLMRRAGWKVSLARGGREAVAAMLSSVSDAQPADLLLLDLTMPGFSGLRVLDALKTHQILTPVVAMTGSLPDPDTTKALQHYGCRHLIAKPFKHEELLRVLQMAMAESI